MKESLDSGRECTAASVSRVITFGLSGEQNTRVGEALPAKGCELFATDAPTDLIAVSAAALIIDSAALDEESRNMLFDYYTEIGSCSDETVFWLGAPGRRDIC